MSFYNPNIQRAFEEDKREFIQLKGVTLATYTIVYRINDGYVVTDLSHIHSKFQLLFQRFENLQQQRNLMLVDSVFPVLMADIALEVLLGSVCTLREYIGSEKTLKMVSDGYEELFLPYKLHDFIELLVYSDIASRHSSKLERDFRRVYCRKNTADELKYFTLYERLKLYDYLIREMRLEIDWEKSDIKKHKACLCLRLRVE
jgi:hypothetical protein